jgi:Acyltransferase
MDYWFRMEIEGWEKLPDPPALLIGIHSGAPLVWDAWTVGVQWWRRFGDERPLHGTAHDALMAMPAVGTYFRRMGVLPAAPGSITAALAAGRDVALWPDGERDSLRPWTQRDEAVLAGRMGFVRLAVRSAVPIVPVATVGGPDSMPVLAKGRRLAKLLALDRVARIKMFPTPSRRAVGHLAGAAARDTAADQGPDRLSGSDRPRPRSRARRRRALREGEVPRGVREHPARDGRAGAPAPFATIWLAGPIAWVARLMAEVGWADRRPPPRVLAKAA